MHIRTCSNHPITLRLWAVILGGFIFPLTLSADYQLTGQINITTEWSPRIYLSAINNFDDRNVASEDFVINVANIDSEGSFVLRGNNLPKEDRLYRLHICKKGDPISTIIIGGQEENHLHFVMNNDANISLSTPTNSLLFDDYQINNLATTLLKQIDDFHNLWKQKKPIASPTSREYNELQLQNQLRLFADTCTNPLLSLWAVYQMDPNINYPENHVFYKNLLDKWQPTQTDSPYFQAFQNQIEYLDFLHFKGKNNSRSRYWEWLIFIFLFLLIGIGIYRKYLTKKSVKAPLSIQERKVFELLKAGKSNKEISSELNIGIATVKSHIYKIYNKTGIRSRKEIMKDQ